MQITYLVRGEFPKYTKNSYNSVAKKKKTQSDLKMGRGTEETVFQRRHTNGHQAHKKMLNLTNHQGNANQNHN